jgi:hypothetical protein
MHLRCSGSSRPLFRLDQKRAAAKCI